MADFPSDLVTVNTTETNDVANAISLGFAFAASAPVNATGVRWYAPEILTIDVYLWDGTGTVIGSILSQATVVGWNTYTFTTAVALTTDVTYTVGIHQDSGGTNSLHYTATAGAFTSTLTEDPISTAASAGRYIYNPSPASFMPNNTSTGWYGVDVVTDEGSAPPPPNMNALGQFAISPTFTAKATKGITATMELDWVPQFSAVATAGPARTPGVQNQQAYGRFTIAPLLAGNTVKGLNASGRLTTAPTLLGRATKGVQAAGRFGLAPTILGRIIATTGQSAYTPAVAPRLVLTLPTPTLELTMDASFTVGDTGTVLAGQILDGTTPVDLTNTTVRLTMRLPRGQSIITRNATITDPAEGSWQYVWTADDLLAGGKWEVVAQVVTTDGDVQSFGPAVFAVEPALA